jgi:pimeloyl-ACP methyl ester carboxylesterase
MADDMMLDMRPDLASIRVPVTLIYPDETPTGAPAGVMQRVYTADFAPVPHMKLVQVETSRHFVMLDPPKVFAAKLDAFLEP